jgi:hypothetical protein
MPNPRVPTKFIVRIGNIEIPELEVVVDAREFARF